MADDAPYLESVAAAHREALHHDAAATEARQRRDHLARSLHEQGVAATEIAEACGTSRRAVYQWMEDDDE